jgi:hypothetical protein
MDTRKLLIGSCVAFFLPTAGALAADATSAAVTTLKANLGNPADLEVDEVRVTQTGVACIDYRASDGQGVKSPGHAVVQGDKVLKSATDAKLFEEKWNEHCLGPRGGMSGGE